MNLQQGQNKLLNLLELAYNGEVMLPDFQRSFVWGRNDIEELIKSLLEDMFIGTFLILHTHPKMKLTEIKPNNLKARDVSNIGHYTNHLPTKIVINEFGQLPYLREYLTKALNFIGK